MSKQAQETSRAAVVTTPADRQVRIERIFDAPRERVWRAFTEPDLVAQWWGRGNKLVIEGLEVRRGGHWRFIEHAGGETHGFEGRYAEVKQPELIVQTFEWDGMPGHVSLETVTFEDLGNGKTRVVNVSLFLTNGDRDGMIGAGMETGLNESYRALDRLLSRAW
jgi:uncharacterized protein YndB with AHSA1/START domain